MLVESVCSWCANTFAYDKPAGARGRLRRHCSEDCARQKRASEERAAYARLSPAERHGLNWKPSKRMPCALCGELMWRGASSRSHGKAMHNKCITQVTGLRQKLEHMARILERAKTQKQKDHSAVRVRPYRACYGYAHQRTRRHMINALVPGTPCAFCGDPMYADQSLDLDHSTESLRDCGMPGDRLTHSFCNRSAGSRSKVRDDPKRANCAICDTEFPYHRFKSGQRTCGRACGAEFRRRNRDAAA